MSAHVAAVQEVHVFVMFTSVAGQEGPRTPGPRGPADWPDKYRDRETCSDSEIEILIEIEIDRWSLR